MIRPLTVSRPTPHAALEENHSVLSACLTSAPLVSLRNSITNWMCVAVNSLHDFLLPFFFQNMHVITHCLLSVPYAWLMS